MRHVIGIDPGGVSGAWSIVDELGRLIVTDDFAVAGEGARRGISPQIFADIVRRHQPIAAAVELGGPRPLEGRSSIYKLGFGSGALVGVLAALSVPTHFVPASVWRRHFHLAQGKESSRQRAHELWPDLAGIYLSKKRDIHRCEASLIGLWLVKAEIASGDGAP